MFKTDLCVFNYIFNKICATGQYEKNNMDHKYRTTYKNVNHIANKQLSITCICMLHILQ